MTHQNRSFFRWYYSDNDTPLARQASGLPVKVFQKRFGIKRFVCRAVLKDISLGGIGFISHKALPDSYFIELEPDLLVQCHSCHSFSINDKLYFYGATWPGSYHPKVLKFIKRQRRINQSTGVKRQVSKVHRLFK